MLRHVAARLAPASRTNIIAVTAVGNYDDVAFVVLICNKPGVCIRFELCLFKFRQCAMHGVRFGETLESEICAPHGLLAR
jgi:DNA-binding LytR/AlgR family response regulator